MRDERKALPSSSSPLLSQNSREKAPGRKGRGERGRKKEGLFSSGGKEPRKEEGKKGRRHRH